MMRYDFMDLPCVWPAASMAAYSAGSLSARYPCHAMSKSLKVHVSLNAAPAALDPIGASYVRLLLNGGHDGKRG